MHRVARWLVLALALWLSASTIAWAASRKTEEKVAAATKSYVLPYMIVMAVVGLGLMTVCRPGKRADKPHEKIKDDEE